MEEWDGLNRRRFMRVIFPYMIHMYLPKRDALSVYTEDLSEAGMRIVIKERMDIGSVVGLKIYVEPDPVVCKGKVIWAKDKENVMLKGIVFFDTGVKFCEIKEEKRQIIRKYIDELSKGSIES